MSSDLYTSLSGAAATWAQMEVISNNLANVSTTGFKGQRVGFKAVGPTFSDLGQVYAEPAKQMQDLRDGNLARDQNPYHLALQGEGFFSVTTAGRSYLTRDGTFSLNQERQLVTVDGDLVMGEGGAIEVPEGEEIRISEDGTIYGSESGEIDKLRIVMAQARQIGGNLWEASGPQLEGSAKVIQGALESSNVNPMGAMVELIEANRYFESYQKLMQASDELDHRLNRSGGA